MVTVGIDSPSWWLCHTHSNMRTRSNSQGGDTTACASSSNGEVSVGKRRKTAAQEEHVDALPTAKRPRPSAEDEAHVAETEVAAAGNAEREPQPAVSAGPAAAELQGVLAPADPTGVVCQHSLASMMADITETQNQSTLAIDILSFNCAWSTPILEM